MTVSVTETLTDATKRLVSIPGAVVLAAFVVFRIGDLVVFESLAGSLVEFVLQQAGYSMLELQSEVSERGLTTVEPIVDQLTSSTLDLPLPVALAMVVSLPFVAEFLHVIGIRAIAADPSEGFDGGVVTDDLFMAYFRSLFAGFIALVLVVVGLGLLVIPGILFALAFFFVRQRVVLADDDIVSALGESYGLFKENALQVVALSVILFVVFLLTTVVGSAIPAGDLSGVVQRFVTSLAVVFGLSVTTSAYLQADPDL